MESLKVGLLACGGMGMSLGGQCAELKNARVTAVCDVDEEKLRAAGEKFEAATYADYRKLLDEAGVNAVIVASPPHLHSPMTQYAAAAGKHILCEKPMSTNVADCDAMVQAAERHGVKLMIAQVLRYLPAFYWLREHVGNGEFGKVCGIKIERIGGGWFGEHAVGWRTLRAESGGFLMEVNAHELDFMRCIAGEARRVFAIGGNYVQKGQDYEDLTLVSVEYQSGAVGILHANQLCHGGMGAYTGRVLCEGGTLFFDNGFSADSPIRFAKADGTTGEQRIGDIQLENPVGHEIRLFVEAVLNDTPVPIPGSEGRAAVELAQAAYRSIATGQPVELPL